MKTLASTFLFILLGFVQTTATFAQQQKPEAFANRFYQTYLKIKVGGLPNATELKAFAPYLSENLHEFFKKAQLEQKRFIKENSADMKPPWADGDIFTSLFEGAQFFKIGKVKTRGIYTEVKINLAYKENGETSRWNDTLVLIKTKQGWRVWDILLNGDWQFKSGSSLRQELGADK